MDHLDKIVHKILQDANEEAEKITNDASQLKDQIIQEKARLAEVESEKIINKAKQEAELIKERIIANAELQERDEKLRAKQEVLDKVFSLAKEKLKQLDDDQYLEFVERTIKNLSLKGSEKLIVPVEKRELVRSLSLPIPIDEEKSVESGFLIQNDKLRMNFDFNFLVDYYREELEVLVAQELFNE